MAAVDLPHELTDGLDIRAVRPVAGGCIARAYQVQTDEGTLFAKTHHDPAPLMFEREAAGLRALRDHATEDIAVPRVLRESPFGLLLEWVEPGAPSAVTERDLGIGLAGLHRATNDTFGGVDSGSLGYLGSVEVDLTPTTSWPQAYAERRLLPLTEQAVRLGRLDPAARALLESLLPRAGELCGPDEPPALLHGDLWAGNRLVGVGGTNWLIDPAASWGHRELDLAMMSLFGGFGADCFTAYHHAYPLADGWRERQPWYQLQPLLVHAILFGGHYGDAALAAMRRSPLANLP